MSDDPWNSRALRRVVVLNALGASILLVSWWLTRSASDFESQERWIAVGVGGVVLAGYGCSAWLAGAMATTKTSKDRLVREIEEQFLGRTIDGSPGLPRADGRRSEGRE